MQLASIRFSWLAGLTLALSGCVPPWQGYTPGQDVSAVTARLGPPKEVYDLPDGGKRLMWPTRPYGEVTTAADIGPDSRIRVVRQVLTRENLERAAVDHWTKDDVRINYGLPEETAYYPLMKREVWTYRYYADDVWYMLYHFYFDDAGVLRMTQNMLDPLHNPDQRSRF